MLDIRELRDNRGECEKNRPNEFAITSKMRLSEVHGTTTQSMDGSSFYLNEGYNEDNEMKSYESTSPPFEYKPNEFSKVQFLAHVAQPGPNERYHYFKNQKQ